MQLLCYSLVLLVLVAASSSTSPTELVPSATQPAESSLGKSDAANAATLYDPSSNQDSLVYPPDKDN